MVSTRVASSLGSPTESAGPILLDHLQGSHRVMASYILTAHPNWGTYLLPFQNVLLEEGGYKFLKQHLLVLWLPKCSVGIA